MYAARTGYEMVGKIGVEPIRAKSKRQTQRLIELAEAAGLEVRSPRGAEQRGGAVIVSVDNERGREIVAELGRRGVLVDFRPGAGVRISPHFYTADAEVETTVAELAAIVRGGSA